MTVSCTVGIWNMTIQNPETFEILTFWRSNFKWFPCSQISIGPHHSKTGKNGGLSLNHFIYRKFFIYIKKQPGLNEPFKNRSKIVHSKSGHVRISDSQISRLVLRDLRKGHFKISKLLKRQFFLETVTPEKANCARRLDSVVRISNGWK